jgi:hypothetical protein
MASPNPATIGILAGYYVAYAAGLIRWHRRVLQPQIVE